MIYSVEFTVKIHQQIKLLEWWKIFFKNHYIKEKESIILHCFELICDFSLVSEHTFPICDILQEHISVSSKILLFVSCHFFIGNDFHIFLKCIRKMIHQLTVCMCFIIVKCIFWISMNDKKYILEMMEWYDENIMAVKI